MSPSQPLYRQQVAASTGGVITLRTEDESASSATFTIRRDGVSVATGSATVGSLPGGAIYSITVPPGLTIEEGYQAEIVPDAGETRRFPFDVVHTPYGPLVTLSDIEQIRPQARRSIEQIASLLNQTADQAAEGIAAQARELLDQMIRDRVERTEHPSVGQAEVILGRPRGEIFLRGYAILDQDRVRSIERFLAVYWMHLKKSDGSGEEDEDYRLAKSFRKMATDALESMGRVRVDVDQDGQGDVTVEVSRTVTLRRRPA